MLSRGPLVRSNGGTALQNVTNLRQVEAEDHSSQSTGHMNLNNFRLYRSQCCPMLVISVLFLMGYGVYRVIIERALANSDRPGSTNPLFVGGFFANH